MHTTLMENIRGAYIAHRWVRLATCAGLFFVAIVLFTQSGGFPPRSWRLLAQVAPQAPGLLARHGLVVIPALLGLVLLAFTLLATWTALTLALVRIIRYELRERQELRRFDEDVAEAQHLAQAAAPLAPTRPVNTPRRTPQPYQARRAEQDDQPFWEPDTEADMEAVMDPADPWMDSPNPGRGAPVRRSPAGAQAHQKPMYVPANQASERAPSALARIDDEESAMDPWMDTEEEHEPDIAEIPTGIYMMTPSATPPPPSREHSAPRTAVGAAVRASTPPSPDPERSRLPAPRAAVASPIPVRSGSRALRNSGRLVAISPDNAAPSYAGPQRATALPTNQPPREEVSSFAEPPRAPSRPTGQLPREFSPASRLQPQPPSARDESVFFAPTTAPVQSVPHVLTTTFYGERNPISPMPVPDYALQELSPTRPASVAPVDYAVHEEAQKEPEPLQLLVGTGLETGIRRRGKPNEDNLLALQNTRSFKDGPCPIGLFVVADGMGGHENGQEASRLVIQSLSESVVPAILYGPADDVYPELLAEGVHRANLAVYQRNRQQKADMGTTITAALIVNTTAYIVNAGDSRTYLYRPSTGLTQVTRDHSTVARLVETGAITPEEVYTHPRRNEIYRCLGRHPTEEFDKFTLALMPGDLLLLCSDGLWEMVHDDEINGIIQSTLPYPSQISSALVQAALNRGGKDNISLVAIYLKGD